MLGFLSTVLYIIIFLLFLSVLIVVHELGHLTAAKIFKVYCYEFSIGMGPAIWKHKKEGKETQFSLRAVPFGGYVSMYGEDSPDQPEIAIDPSRSINGIKKWKKAIILVAGVTMNAVLALVLFFVNNVAFDQQSFLYTNMISVVEESKCDIAGLSSQKVLAYDESWTDESSFMLKDVAQITLNDDSVVDARVILSPTQSFVNPVYTYYFIGVKDGQYTTTINYSADDFKSVTYILKTKDSEGNDADDYSITLNVVDGALEDNGLRCYVLTFHYSFGEAVVQTFDDFGYSATAIIKSFGMLFTGQVGVDQLSGIVGIGFEAKNVLDSFGFSKFLFLWGLISVNLAIVNLVPFPGLDGWQLLVTAIEGITHKKFPEKVQGIVSFVGLAILIVAMVALLAKDIWVYVLQGLFSGIVLW